MRICPRSKKWWIGEIKYNRRSHGREKRRRHRSAATAQAKAELQKSIGRARVRMWND